VKLGLLQCLVLIAASCIWQQSYRRD